MKKAEQYEAIQRLGFYLPVITSTIVTKSFLDKVHDKKEWCPKYVELKMRPCTRPPNKSYFIAEIQKILKQQDLILTINT